METADLSRQADEGDVAAQTDAPTSFCYPTEDERRFIGLVEVLGPAIDRKLQRDLLDPLVKESSHGKRLDIVRKYIENSPPPLMSFLHSDPAAQRKALRPYMRLSNFANEENAAWKAEMSLRNFERRGGHIITPAPMAKNISGSGVHHVYMEKERAGIDFRLSRYKFEESITVGPKWDSSSCAFDVGVMLLFIGMGAGVRQLDQLTPSALLELTPLARMWRELTDINWGAIERPRRQELLGGMVRALQAATELGGDVQGWSAGQQISMQDALAAALEGLPQVALSVTSAQVCEQCDLADGDAFKMLHGIHLARSAGRAARAAKARGDLDESLPGNSLGARVTAWFLYDPPLEDHSTACRCGGRRGRVRLVNGLPPPRLVVFPSPESAEEDVWLQDAGHFRSLSIDYYVRDEKNGVHGRTTTYEVSGIVTCMNENHFVLNSPHGRAPLWSCYDGMAAGGKVTGVQEAKLRAEMKQAVQAGARAQVVVWRRVDCVSC